MLAARQLLPTETFEALAGAGDPAFPSGDYPANGRQH
jgi:hypothetical protein